MTSQTATSPRPQRLRVAEPRSRRSSNCCSAAMARLSPSLSPPPAGCRTRRGRRSPACASAATPSGLIGPTRREDRSIGSSRRSWGNMAPHSRRRLAKRHRIDRSAPRGSDPVGRRDGEATESEPGRQGTGPANAIGVRARNARHVGREAFRPQRGSASPPLAKPFGRGRSRPSSGMAAHARARLPDPGRGIRGSRSGDLAASARAQGGSLRVRGTPVPLQAAGRRRARASGSSPELCWSGNGTAVWSGS